MRRKEEGRRGRGEGKGRGRRGGEGMHLVSENGINRSSRDKAMRTKGRGGGR